MKQVKVLLALGSNRRQEENLKAAKQMVGALLDDCRFTPCLWTKPVKVVSDRFLNALALGTTSLPLEQLRSRLKEVERTRGDQQGAHARGTVNLDIDILLYGTRKLKKADWNRPYVRQLIGEHLADELQDLTED